MSHLELADNFLGDDLGVVGGGGGACGGRQQRFWRGGRVGVDGDERNYSVVGGVVTPG